MEELFNQSESLLTIEQASAKASELLGQDFPSRLIQELLKSKKVSSILTESKVRLRESELKAYFNSRQFKREQLLKRRIGADLHWHLSFDQYKESETTKHVHRLHPYKGKYIPQLVEYFLDKQTDQYKTNARFKPGDVILDPFCGSGTTLVQSNELGLHCIGIDVAPFNCEITNAKITKVDLSKFLDLTQRVETALANCEDARKTLAIDSEISRHLSELNARHFPKSEFPQRVRSNEIDAVAYSQPYVSEFTKFYKTEVLEIDIHRAEIQKIKPSYRCGFQTPSKPRSK